MTALVLTFVLCLAASFLLSGMEAGVFALSRLRIRQQTRKGNRRAMALYGYLEDPERFLWTILVGNTLANFGMVVLGVLALHHWLSAWPVLFFAALVAGFVLFYCLFELLPKTLFRIYPNRFCMYVAPYFRVIYLGLTPMVSLTTLVADSLLRWTGGKRFTGRLFGTREELRRVMQESAQGLTTEERLMINRVLDLQNVTVRQVLIPMAKVTALSVEAPVREVLAICRERGFSRLPAFRQEGNRRRVAGLIDLNNLIFQSDLDENQPAGDFLKPALFIAQDTLLEVALRQMQRKGQRLAIVLDQHQLEAGVVSLQDILKFIFGEVSL